MSATAAERVRVGVEGLAPGYFALVMASGIVSVGMQLEGHRHLSMMLLVVSAVGLAVLVVLNLWRLLAYRGAIAADFLDPRRAFGFFTFVAGTNVVGVSLAMQGHHSTTGWLLSVAAPSWLILGYVVPWTAVLGPHQRPVVATANGTWFIWVVASQSVAVSAATLELTATRGRDELAVLAVVAWAVGIFVYAAAGVFVALRLMDYDFGPKDLTAPYWVSMGALAITVVAGARIAEMADVPMVTATGDLVAGLSALFWAFATWLLPVLVAAEWWRHVTGRIPFHYGPTWWDIVFPLGMYAVAGISLGTTDRLSLVGRIGSTELWLAAAVWVVVFLAMVRHLALTLLLPRSANQGS